jgi:hypothetical protein
MTEVRIVGQFLSYYSALNLTNPLKIIFQGAKIDLVKMSSYDLHLFSKEVECIRNYIKVPEFQTWARRYSKTKRMTVELLQQYYGMWTGDLFDHLDWPRGVLALRLPIYEGNATLADIVLPKLLIKVARIVNEAREVATDDSGREEREKSSGLNGLENQTAPWRPSLLEATRTRIVAQLSPSITALSIA